MVDAESKVAVRPITVAQQDDTRAVISDGLKAQEQVVTTGFTRLSNGTRVRVQAGEGEQPCRAERSAARRRARRKRGGARGQRQRRRSESSARPRRA